VCVYISFLVLPRKKDQKLIFSLIAKARGRLWCLRDFKHVVASFGIRFGVWSTEELHDISWLSFVFVFFGRESGLLINTSDNPISIMKNVIFHQTK
jgi:hypothetical protein